MTIVAFDTETFRFKMGAILPRLVCGSFATRVNGELVTDLQVAGDGTLHGALRSMLKQCEQGEIEVVGQNVAFDLGVTVANYPDLMHTVWECLAAGRVHDTMIREKLLTLSTTGSLEYLPMPDGSNLNLTFSLVELEKRYLGRDRSGDKDFATNWRGNYEMLVDTPYADWPEDAKNYAIEDAEGTLRVFERQEEFLLAHVDRGTRLTTDTFQVGVSFCLQLMSAWGLRCDEKKRDEIAEQLRAELAPERMEHLIRVGILRTPKAPRLIGKGEKQRWTKGDGESINKKKLHAFIVQICQENGLEVRRNDPTEKMLETADECEDTANRLEAGNTSDLRKMLEKAGFKTKRDIEAAGPNVNRIAAALLRERAADLRLGSVRADKDVLEEIKDLDPVLEEYAYRQYLDKLVNTEIPRMSGPIIHPRYNVLVETGRTSSYGSDDYPSANIQNVSAVKKLKDAEGNETGEEINIRHCYVARPAKVLVSVDFDQLEFCSMGQTCYSLFRHSVMRDLINSGRDPHAFLGAQIGARQHNDFIELCMLHGIINDKNKTYDVFKAFEKADDKTIVKFYKQYRKLAKPVGFGFPGGLGFKKFVSFAKAHPYYVVVTEDQAKELKNIWMDTFIEMRDYFDLLNSGRYDDPHNSKIDPEDRRKGKKYRYETPLGMVRAGATYTALANGLLLQGPASEGAKLAVWESTRSCYDPGYNKILYGQRPVAFIHDEILFEMDDDAYLSERAHEAARVMISAMQSRMPDVQIRAKPAAMYRWDKEAEPTYVDGCLVAWDREKARVAA